MSADHTQQHAEEVRQLIEDRLRIKALTLDAAVRKAGRLLPGWARRDARCLVQAEEMSRHPKLHRQIDAPRVAKAHENLTRHLTDVDPNERRKTRILGILGVISFNLILIVAAFVAYLVWGGYV